MLFCIIAFIIYNTPYGYCKQINMPKTINNYGPYNLVLDYYRPCCGPKAVNLTELSVDIENGEFTTINVTYLEDILISQLKIFVYTVDSVEVNKVLLWVYKDNTPCQHYPFSALFKEHLNAPNCLVKKGFYSARLNVKEIVKTFLGKSFFYGVCVFKAILLSKKGNIVCIVAQISFMKKT